METRYKISLPIMDREITVKEAKKKKKEKKKEQILLRAERTIAAKG